MYKTANYITRGLTFLNNQAFPGKKKLSTLMLYGTDLCNSACKHCLIWTKRPVSYLSLDKIKEIMKSKCITRNTTIGLEGGEFLLHPDAFEIMEWFTINHPNFDLLTNALLPEKVIEGVTKFPPRRLFISLDGDKNTYQTMRGKDGYDGIINVIEALHNKIPISVMFTLSPYNDFDDMEHVAQVCKKYDIDMRIGIYNDINFFDTVETAHKTQIGSQKGEEKLVYSTAMKMIEGSKKEKKDGPNFSPVISMEAPPLRNKMPVIINEFKENNDFITLYDNWRKGNLKLKCYSILDSLVIYPNGDIPICQSQDFVIGNIHKNTLDEIFNSPETRAHQKEYSLNCNACWLNFHRKYDVILYRNFEKFFGRWVTRKLLGYYWWEEEKKKTYKQSVNF
ncbi:MAG: radical SAM protein [Bacteroidia bacterium]|nr:radical SAM protein [Bacteroidia bacterium]